MFPSVFSCVRTFRRPANVFCTTVDPINGLFIHGRTRVNANLCNIPMKSNAFYCIARAYPKYSIQPMPSVQQCQFSTDAWKRKSIAAVDKHKQSRPVKTEIDPAVDGEEKLSAVDNNSGENVEVNTSRSSKDYMYENYERSRPKIIQQYMQARDKVQEKIEQVKDMKENIFTIPNMLTISRIVLSPVLGYLVIHEYYTLAASLFLFTSATDVLDGWIARNFKNQQSVLGSIIDPLADKVLVSVLTVSLTISGLIPLLLTVIIVGRDIGLITSVFWLRYKSLSPPRTLSRYFDITHTTVRLQPTTISKFNTLIQVALVGVSIGAPLFNYIDHPLLQALWYVTGTSTVLSGLSYMFLKDTFKYVRKVK